MKKTLYLILLLPLMVFVATCNKRSGDGFKSVEKADSIPSGEAAPSASTLDQEKVKALSNINFYISEKEFEKQKNKLKQRLQQENRYSNGSYFIEDYTFQTVQGKFHDDSLFNVRIEGTPVRYDNYDSKLENQFNSLVSVLEEKYGPPSFKENLPRWSELSDDELNVLAQWNTPYKKILIWVVHLNSDYRIDLAYFVPDMLKRKQAQLNKDFRKDRLKAVEMM